MKGRPASVIRELKRRGTVTSAKEAAVQGICDCYDDYLRRDLRRLEV